MVAQDILDVVASNQESLNWLANDGRQHIADARLTVFRGEEHFAVFTEFPISFTAQTSSMSGWDARAIA